jgi:hypothetical protein
MSMKIFKCVKFSCQGIADYVHVAKEIVKMADLHHSVSYHFHQHFGGSIVRNPVYGLRLFPMFMGFINPQGFLKASSLDRGDKEEEPEDDEQ